MTTSVLPEASAVLQANPTSTLWNSYLSVSGATAGLEDGRPPVRATCVTRPSAEGPRGRHVCPAETVTMSHQKVCPTGNMGAPGLCSGKNTVAALRGHRPAPTGTEDGESPPGSGLLPGPAEAPPPGSPLTAPWDPRSAPTVLSLQPQASPRGDTTL